MFIQEFEKTAIEIGNLKPIARLARKNIGSAIKKNPLKAAAVAGGTGLAAGAAMGGSKEAQQPNTVG